MTTLLIDSNNVAIRSYFAPHQEMTVGDIDTGPLVLFINTVARYVRLHRPGNALACWDSGKSAYRTRVFPEYKANRKQKSDDQAQIHIALMQSFLKVAGFPQLQLPGYEGDDLIAASWRACRGHERIFILSSDKDMLQLLEDGTEQLRLISGGSKPDRWDRNRFIREMGFKPEYQAWMLALVGDASDGIPGLAKVGPKTAIKMLIKYDWDMGRLIESLSEADQDRVLTNIALTDLALCPIELPPPPTMNLVGPSSPHWDKLEDFCDKWQLAQVKRRLVDGSLWSD